MTKNSISSIFRLIHEAFGDRATSIANIYTIHCNSRQIGVVDTLTVLSSLKVECHIGTALFHSFFHFFFFYIKYDLID